MAKIEYVYSLFEGNHKLQDYYLCLDDNERVADAVMKNADIYIFIPGYFRWINGNQTAIPPHYRRLPQGSKSEKIRSLIYEKYKHTDY